jgi:hypothetical protein
MTISVTDKDGNAVTLPVTPPTTVWVCLSKDCRPGKVKLRWSDPFAEPTETPELTDQVPCYELRITANITGLLAYHADSQDVVIV